MIFRKIGLIGNISLVYKILLGVLVVTVDVFGIVDVKEVKNHSITVLDSRINENSELSGKVVTEYDFKTNLPSVIFL